MARTAPDTSRSSRRRPSKALGIALVALGVVVVLAIAAAVAGWYLLYKPDHSIAAGKPVEISIESGSSTAEIASELSEAGVVDNALMFRWQARQAGAESDLRSGSYEFTTGMGYEGAIAKLTKGPEVVYYDVTIPEGFSVKQIAARFAKRASIDEAEFLELAQSGAAEFEKEHPYLSEVHNGSLEGYLFPLTYRVKDGTSAREAIEMMLDGFDAQMADVDLSYAESKNLTLDDVVIIASLIEREVSVAEEYPLVASVVYNRLRTKMRLQLDSTALYGLPDGTQVLTAQDLRNDHPYNTYTNFGLTPGPISNPGLQALKAAANPPKTDYLYYVRSGKGEEHTFTSSYEEFLVAKRKYNDLIGQ